MPQAKQQDPEPQQEQEPEVGILVNLLGETRPLWQLLDEAGVPDGSDYAEIISQIAGLQGQIEKLRADMQDRFDELAGQRAEQKEQRAAKKAAKG